MIRDPFYRQIIKHLCGELDPELFEQAVADLLRAAYPALVPIRGGSDAGMDGAIADGLGEPFPLVTTTGADVIGNLTRNLRKYIDEGGQRRKAVFATSQSLTPRRIRNLHRRANELGFVLVQVHAQADMADRLYRSPEWCRELLGLTGNPPALSAVPLSNRPLFMIPLIGRDADLTWLRQTPEDRLLVGQPGSGKTFLLNQLVRENDALFVVSAERAEIAANLRSQRPRILIVDDAQGHQELLLSLRQMREELGGDFSIVASCWPGDTDAVANTLGLVRSRIRELDLLPRDEIVQVINEAGIGGPNDLVREIVNQAEGKPGLAVTLAQFCLRGGVREVALGDVLSRSILQFFEPRIGHDASLILATIAVSGDAGMSMQAIASTLGLSLVIVRDVAINLAAGGVISEVQGRLLVVRPPALRYTLVRDIFYQGALSYPIAPVLEQISDLQQATLTLLSARARGARIPSDLLISLVEQVNSRDAWIAFAWLGQDEAGWVIQHHPEVISAIAWPCLYLVPESVIPLLLAAAIGDGRPLNSTPEHPLRLLSDWIQDAHPDTDDVIERHRILLDAGENWLVQGGDVGVGFKAIGSALSPSFQYDTLDPGLGNQVTFTYGYVSRADMLVIQGFWPRVLALLRRFGLINWKSIRELAETWIYPGRMNVNIPDETYEQMRSFATQVLRDIVALAADRPGILHWAQQVASNSEIDIAISPHPEFEILYPQRDHSQNWQEAEQRDSVAVRQLAQRWSRLQPEDVVTQVMRIETEALETDARWPRWTPFLCKEIAAQVAAPSDWVRVMIAENCTADLVQPFLQRSAEIGENDWPELAYSCLHHAYLKWATVSLVLTSPNPPPDLLEQVLSDLHGYAEAIKVHCLRNEIAEHILLRLLQNPDSEIAGAAAEGEWHAEPVGVIRDSLQASWQQVIAHRVRDDYFLSEVFPNNPALAYQWLQTRFAEEEPQWFRHDFERALHVAANAISVEERRTLLHQIPAHYRFSDLIGSLVNDHLELFHELLSIDRLRDYHLAPLAGNPEGVWFEKAIAALEAGYDAQEVAAAVYGHPVSSVMWSGSESRMRSEWIERFERLGSHADERIRHIGEIGRAHAQSAYERAVQRERREAVYGR